MQHLVTFLSPSEDPDATPESYIVSHLIAAKQNFWCDCISAYNTENIPG